MAQTQRQMVALRPDQTQVLTMVTERLDLPRGEIIKDALLLYLDYLKQQKQVPVKETLDPWQKATRELATQARKRRRKYPIRVEELDVADGYRDAII